MGHVESHCQSWTDGLYRARQGDWLSAARQRPHCDLDHGVLGCGPGPVLQGRDPRLWVDRCTFRLEIELDCVGGDYHFERGGGAGYVRAGTCDDNVIRARWSLPFYCGDSDRRGSDGPCYGYGNTLRSEDRTKYSSACLTEEIGRAHV